MSGTATHRWLRTLLRAAARLVALAAVFLFFAAIVPEGRFLEVRNLENILVQSAVVAAAATGATLVILAGGIDLSVGSAVALATVATALVLRAGGDAIEAGGAAAAWWPLLAALVGVVAAGAVGLLNGVLVGGARLGAFIVTLGTMQVVRGVSKGLAGSGNVYPPESWLTGLLESVRGGGRGWMLLPPGVWVVLLLAALTAFVVHATPFGRHAVAVGSSEETARLCGVRTGRVKMGVFILAGLCAGVVGVLQFAYVGLGDPTTAIGLELYAIAAVVIGGGSLRGGEGSIAGTIAGALVIAVLDAGGVQMGWPSWGQEVVAGAIIVGAVALDRWRAGPGRVTAGG